MKIRTFATRAALATGVLSVSALFATPAGAQWRYVVVNGQQLHPRQVVQIEALYCAPIANGRYWYDTRTGVWGYEGDPRPQGRFVYRCNDVAATTQQRGSLSERGLLYSMHEILQGRP